MSIFHGSFRFIRTYLDEVPGDEQLHHSHSAELCIFHRPAAFCNIIPFHQKPFRSN